MKNENAAGPVAGCDYRRPNEFGPTVSSAGIWTGCRNVGPNLFGLCFKVLEQAQLLPRRRETTAIEAEILIATVVAQALTGQLEPLSE